MELNKILTIDVSNIKKPIIYFLYNLGELVYIGQSEQGFIRTLQHKDKQYDKVDVFDGPSDTKERILLETKLILKHKPRYNNITLPQTIDLIENGYCRIEKIKDKLKTVGRYDITGKLLNSIKKIMPIKKNGKVIYVPEAEIERFILSEYGISV